MFIISVKAHGKAAIVYGPFEDWQEVTDTIVPYLRDNQKMKGYGVLSSGAEYIVTTLTSSSKFVYD